MLGRLAKAVGAPVTGFFGIGLAMERLVAVVSPLVLTLVVLQVLWEVVAHKREEPLRAVVQRLAFSLSLLTFATGVGIVVAMVLTGMTVVRMEWPVGLIVLSVAAVLWLRRV